MKINNNLVLKKETKPTKMTKLPGRAKEAVLDFLFGHEDGQIYTFYQFPRFNTLVNNSHAFKAKTLPWRSLLTPCFSFY